MIKSAFLASLAVVALAAPEANPQLLYSAGLPYTGLGLPYAAPLGLAAAGAVPHVPVVKSVEETPAEVKSEVTAHALPLAVGYHGLGLGYAGHYIGKREAEADPAILAGATKILTPPTPLIHNPPVLPVAHVAAPAVVPGAYGYGLPYGYGHYIGKREAEADPAILAGSTKILTPPTPLIHNPPVLPVAHVAAPAVVPAAYGYGLPYGYGHYIGKRSADADADAQVLAYAGLPYTGLPYAAAPLLASAGAVAHAPVVKSVEVTPAEVSSEVTAHALPVAVGYHGLGLGYAGHLGYLG